MHVLILGLDHAGKTVRPCACMMGQNCVWMWMWMNAADPHKMQTLLEQSKGIFRKIQGLPPDKVTPTVGLNGEWLGC